VVAQPSNVSQPDSLSVWVLLALIWAKTGWWLTLVIPLFLIPFLFPTGRFLTRRRSWAGWLAGFLATEAFITEAFAEAAPLRASGHSTIQSDSYLWTAWKVPVPSRLRLASVS
jgi:hypothetical protein